jgi:hypothetical protein
MLTQSVNVAASDVDDEEAQLLRPEADQYQYGVANNSMIYY